MDARWIPTLSADKARDVKQFVATGPRGKFKAVVMRLDGASSQALNALLKVLEEPPATSRFLLLAERSPLDTIVSRSMVYRVGVLSEEDLYKVLLGLTRPEIAAKAAKLGRGQVKRALQIGDIDQTRATVQNFLKAVASKDRMLAEQVVSKWDDKAARLLVQWAGEAITGRWCVYTAEDTYGLHLTDTPRQLLQLLRLQARPRLAARVAVEALM